MSRPLLLPAITSRYEIEQRVFRTPALRYGMTLVVIAIIVIAVNSGGFWLSVTNLAGIYALGAMSLNLMSGDAGQVSLGQSFFVGLGAYTGAFLSQHGWPLPAALAGAGVLAAASSCLIGPFVLRLRGLYFALGTVVLIFLAQYLFENFTSITGGPEGLSVPAPQVGGFSFATGSTVAGIALSSMQKWFLFLVIPLVLIVGIALKNLQRSRIGRAAHAIRDHDMAADVIGINLTATKVQLFALSSGIAGISGALLGAFARYISPTTFGLDLSIQFLAMIIIGGLGSVTGGILGAAFITFLPQVIEKFAGSIPFVVTNPATTSGLNSATLSSLLYGLLIVVFLVAQPEGLVGWASRIRAYFATWPFRR